MSENTRNAKPESERRSSVCLIKMTSEEKQSIIKKSMAHGLSTSAFIRMKALAD